MKFEYLCENNVEQYLSYLKQAMSQEPDMMTAETIDEAAIRQRISDPFYRSSKSLLAFDKDKVVGRIEYHFYGCMQDGYRMAYVDWVYVLPEARHRGVAQQLFQLMEEDCRKNNIDQYYLIRAENDNAKRFYDRFEQASTKSTPVLRKTLTE